MSRSSADLLRSLLPGVYWVADIEANEVLEALISSIAEQWDSLREQVGSLYDDVFLETCQEAFLPYFGEQIGVVGISPQAIPGLSLRSWIAQSTELRQHKGTLGALAKSVTASTGWSVYVQSGPDVVARTQSIRYCRGRPGMSRTVNVRDLEALSVLADPWSNTTRLVGVDNGPGPRNTEISIWRLRAFPVDQQWSAEVDVRGVEAGRARTFNPFGIDQPLFLLPKSAPADSLFPPRPENIDQPILRTASVGRILGGDEPAFRLYEDGRRAIHRDDIDFGDLSDWRVPTGSTKPVIVDPELGRILYTEDTDDNDSTDPGVRVDYSFGLSGEVGAGPAVSVDQSSTSNSDPPEIVAVVQAGVTAPRTYPTIEAALAATTTNQRVVVRIDDSATHIAPGGTHVALGSWEISKKGGSLRIVAGQGFTPALVGDINVQLESAESSPDAGGARQLAHFHVTCLSIKGVLQVKGSGTVRVDHTTLVPLHVIVDSTSAAGKPSMILESADPGLAVSVCASISGPISTLGKVSLAIADSIIDAADEAAIGNSGRNVHRVALHRTTVFGSVWAGRAVVDTSLLTGYIVNADSSGRVSSDQARGLVCSSWWKSAPDHPEPPNIAPLSDLPADEDSWVRPLFVSTRFGDPGYAQLAPDCPAAIRHGGPLGTELGVWSNLEQPARADRLADTVLEFLPAGQTATVVVRS